MDSRISEWACFFSGHAPFYEDNCSTANTLAEVDFLLDELGLQPGQSIELARRGYQVPGVDLSTGMLSVARAHAEAAGVTDIWGGTAGGWNRDPLNLDEFEIMVVACRPHERVTGLEALLQAFPG